ncbi:unnamed protein product [Orchesella dallaii]|uniref:beta-mannosidase n=1 Tax=Orchesella dallaii TaxID=48710 RepID=A0ABP1PNB4_9HEXA
MSLKFISLIVAAICIAECHAAFETYDSGIQRITLNSIRGLNVWTASSKNGTEGEEISVPAGVPGGIYSDLEESNVLGSAVYHEYNDMENKWVGRLDWTFTRDFVVSPEVNEKSEIVLVCEGLDTVAEVFINDVSVGNSENMFARYVFDVKSAVKEGQNTIRVAFRSPVEYAQTKFREHNETLGYKVVPESLVPEYRGENQAQMIRKMQAAFSWDWGPSYPNSGIWKNIYIEAYNGAIIRDVMIFSEPNQSVPDESNATTWTVTARVYYDSGIDEEVDLSFERVDSTVATTTKVNITIGKGNSVDISLTELGDQIKLWWPNGYGDQNLYWYNVDLNVPQFSETTSRRLRFGFRKVELIEDFVDKDNVIKGREFYFVVNGKQMYSKGSNSIPLHVLTEKITNDQTEWLLRAAKMSHQNMIRVWGGGMYETDTFFDYADEYGIFIWEDFMFACAMYPATDEYLDIVRQEVDTQVKRLQYRTSLVMWAANNENEAALRHDWYGSGWNFDLYKGDYIKLYIDTIKTMTEELDPSRKFISSSPTNGIQSQEEGWVAADPYDLKYGDIHFYNYVSDNWDWNMFLRTRYASEYGFQSFPHYESLAEVANDITTWTWDSPMMDHRQHHPGGQKEIRDLIKMHFPFPENYDSTEAFPYMLYMAQLSQIMGQKTQTEFYRRLMDKMDTDGTGHNMGALYWQLNDIWEGCSWASVEAKGRWKLQMYYAVKFFAPVLASPYLNADGDVVVELISDNPQRFSGNLKVQVFRLSSLDAVLDEEVHVEAEFLKSKEVFTVNRTTLESLDCGARAMSDASDPCVVYLTLPGTPDNFLFLQYPTNKLALRQPNLRVALEAVDAKTVSISIETDAVAPFVFLTNAREDHLGYFSDNGFLLATKTKKIEYYSESGITPQQLQEQLNVMSLFDVTTIRYATTTTRRPVETTTRNTGNKPLVQTLTVLMCALFLLLQKL